MSADGSPSGPPAPTLFISYASQDREAAPLLRDSIGATGIEVWYDKDDLTGGDAWDQKIRRRIRECDYFMPVVSDATEARREGYFRREWRQAAECTLDMADDVMFLLPVNISGITEAGAHVPERFNHIHWTRCPDGKFNADLEELCRRVLTGNEAPPEPRKSRPSVRPKKTSSAPASSQKKSKDLPPTLLNRTARRMNWLGSMSSI